MIRTLILIVASLAAVSALSCFCGTSPCQTPTCCDSGRYTKDACGCCLTCAQPEEGACGGPFQTTGTCAAGLRCLRKCGCKTVTGKSCIFPFTYKGETHNKCTNAGSDNGAVWCATNVDKNGEVVRNTWEDCDEGCPGTAFECNESFLFNVDGKCVNGTSAPSLLRELASGPLAGSLDHLPDEFTQKEAPLCTVARDTTTPSCRCSSDLVSMGLDGNPRGGCVEPLVDHGIDEFANGWCFLENIADEINPTNGCYDDTEWSAADGRFWSNKACIAAKRQAKSIQVEDIEEEVVQEVIEEVPEEKVEEIVEEVEEE